MTYLEKGGLAALPHGIDAVLVEAARRGDGRVVVHALSAVHRPVVVAVVVHVAVAVEDQPVLAGLLSQGA